jgi:phosphate:Na+ symporter
MQATLTLVDLAGTIALLLWGVHMVQSGIQRAFGSNLRRFLAAAMSNRLHALLAGLGITALLQSSTATGLMTTSFAAAGLIELVPALAVMLGANVGTTLIVQVLSFDVALVAPVFVLVGYLMFRRGATRTHDLGRVGIGLGLVLLAMQHLLTIITPYEDVPSLRLLLGMVTTEPLVDVILAAALTWASHSSAAMVLLIMSFAAKGVVPPYAAFALVLGANLGTAFNPVLEGAAGGDPISRRLPLGNLLNRLIGCVLALAALPWIAPLLVSIEPNAARAVADFHTAFNLALAVLFLPLLAPFARLLRRLLPERTEAADPWRPLYLDASARELPSAALAGAARECLRMADTLESMLRNALDLLDGTDRKRIAATRRMDDVLDRLNEAIKLYLTSLDPDDLSESDHQRLQETLAFATNIEQAGDALASNIMGSALKRLKRGLSFSREGEAELRHMLERLLVNLRWTIAAFMTGDAAAARLLALEKEIFRDLEARAVQAHFERLRAGRVESAETSALHLDLLRDLKRVNAHLVSAAAYPVLTEQGELLSSRLRDEMDGRNP